MINQHSRCIAGPRWLAGVVATILLVLCSSAGWTSDRTSSLQNQTGSGETESAQDGEIASPTADGKATTPLPRPTSRTTGATTSWNKKLPRPSGQMLIVLGIVAGLALVWRLTRGSERNLPSDLVEVYGRVPLNPKQHLHLVRVGSTLLVLIESAQGLQRLAEITDPEEVRNITRRFRKDGTDVVPPELSDVVSAGRHLASFRSA